MTDLDVLKQVWKAAVPQGATRIGGEEVRSMIQSRTADIRQRTIRRVRAESYNYLALAVIPVLMLSLGGRSTSRTILASIGVLATLAPILGVLAYKEYRLRTLTASGSLRESLAALVAAIDSTSRFYFATYMICVAVGIASAAGFLLWHHPASWLTAGVLIAGAAFAGWAWRSGRAYARRMFGRYRAELTSCLEELEEPESIGRDIAGNATRGDGT
ncbi:MAG TPA: hypothetical protein VFW45_04630 [Candidatus Polarisedimenticolia bacterium]|nr:hypothetical protein [Candidatus Polarisedimenticolia bacterium]